MEADHVIEIVDEDDGRIYWECSCGQGGSCPESRFNVHAESHVPLDDSIAYRHRAWPA